MLRSLSLLVSLIFFCNAVPAQNSVPIKQVRLYKNGMAYIVRSGEIENPLSLSFPVKDMNDILKSFAAWNPEKNTLYPTGYTAGIPLDQLLSRYPFNLRDVKTGLAEFLQQVRGTGLKISTGSKSFSGTLMTVKAREKALDDKFIEDHQIALVLDDGTLLQCWLSEIIRINLADEALNEQLNAYLKAMSQGIDGATSEVTVYPVPEKGALQIAYLQQFPIWKSTYRLDMGDKIEIQGWAQVDNPSGEGWNGVALTLISGTPASFVTNLYEPMYATRSRIDLPGSYVPVAPVHEAAVRKSISRAPSERNAIYGVVSDSSGGLIPGVTVTVFSSSDRSRKAITDEQGYYQITGLAPTKYSVIASLTGFRDTVDQVQLTQGGQVRRDLTLIVGQITETVTAGSKAGGVRAGDRPFPPRPSSELALGEKIQDYFEYSFPDPITLEPGQSARVPFLNQSIKAGKVSILSPANPHPYFAVELENDTGMPMDAGPVTVFQEGSYSGETMMDHLSPGDKRLLSYGIDHEIENSFNSSEDDEKLTSVLINSGVMVCRWETRRETEYLIKNNSDSGKNLILEHTKVSNQKIITPIVNEESANYHRFRLALGPHEERKFPIVEGISSNTSLMVGNIDRNDLEFYFSNVKIPKSLMDQFKHVIELSDKVSELQKNQRKLDQNRNAIYKDQDRLRENFKALGNSDDEKDLRKRYLLELEAQENQLKSIAEQFDQLNIRIKEAEGIRNDAVSAIRWEGQFN